MITPRTRTYVAAMVAAALAAPPACAVAADQRSEIASYLEEIVVTARKRDESLQRI